MDKDSVLKTFVLADVNQHIGAVAAGQDEDAPAWEFFCECGRADCHGLVMLTLGEYVALLEAERPVLAPGHRLSQAQRARRLREEAKALRAQAEQQVKRARAEVDTGEPEKARLERVIENQRALLALTLEALEKLGYPVEALREDTPD